MGILSRPAAIIEWLAPRMLPSGFAVCELGNQFYRAGGGKEPARGWYERLGCRRYVSIDGNGAGTWIADLNHPLTGQADGQAGAYGEFDLVTDFGTGEHIFNQAQVWETLHDLCKVDGLIVIDRPQTGWAEHCFYNIHETLIHDIVAANGYGLAHLETHAVEGHGDILFAVLQKREAAAFRYPQQAKYRKRLKAAGALIGTDAGPARVTRITSPPYWGPPYPAFDAGSGHTMAGRRVRRREVLEQIVKANGWTKGAEIGVLEGGTYFHLLDTCPDLTMIAVDAWAVDAADYGDLTEVGVAFRDRAALYPPRSIVMHGPSAEMAPKVADGSLDFVFIDATHTTEAVRADIAAWAPKVRQYGAVMGHDIDWPSVAIAVREAYGDAFQVLPDDVWGVVKKA